MNTATTRVLVGPVLVLALASGLRALPGSSSPPAQQEGQRTPIVRAGEDIVGEPGIAALGYGQWQVPVPPNVLVIVLDDIGTDKLSLYEPPTPNVLARTPRLEALADQGVLFTNYYTNPLCSTSRACLLTGRYSFRIRGVPTSLPFLQGLGSILNTPSVACPSITDPYCFRIQDSEVFLPELLRYGFSSSLPASQRYSSGAFGKYHLSYDGLEEHAAQNGFERFYGMMGNTAPSNPNQIPDHFLWRKVEHDQPPPPAPPVPADIACEDVTTWDATVAQQDAVEWINQQNNPFFAYVAFNPPHAPFQVPPFSLLSQATRDELDAACLQEREFDDNLPPDQRQLIFRASIEAVDSEIGNLIDGIAPGKLAHTMIFVMSDNGTPNQFVAAPHTPSHGKNSPYQIGVRVPMLVSGPLVPASARGQECDQLVNAVDLWRTVRDLTGASESLALTTLGPPAPYTIDSRSFLPLIGNPQGPSIRNMAFSQVFTRNGWYGAGTVFSMGPIDCLDSNERAITDGVFKYIRQQTAYTAQCQARSFTYELYKIDVDPEESINWVNSSDVVVSGAPAGAVAAHAALRAEMIALSETGWNQ